MGFLKKTKKQTAKSNSQGHYKKPFYKKRGWKVFFVIAGLILITGISFAAYLYATGSRIFVRPHTAAESPLLKAIKGDKGIGQNRINIALLGFGGDNHPGAYLTDSIMILSVDPDDKEIAMVSIPRDLLVSIPGHGQGKINTAFADGYNDYMSKSCKSKNTSSCKDSALSAGADLSTQTISNVIGQSVQYYADMDFAGFQQIIDKIGGVDINVEKAIYDRNYPAYDNGPTTTFSISSGQHHMDGALALKYARSRESTSDFDRAHRQQQILEAVKKKILNLGFLSNPKNLIDLVNIVSGHVRTNFSPTEIEALATFFKGVDSSHIINKVLDNSASGPFVDSTINGTYYLVPKTGNFNSVKDIVGNIFDENGENTSSQNTKANIEIINAAGISGAAGKLASKLEANGYKISDTQTSNTLYQKTVIYDYTNSKYKKDIQFLEDGLGLFNVVKKTKSSVTNQDVNITIILGKDYQGFTSPSN